MIGGTNMLQVDWMNLIFTILNIVVLILIIVAVIYYYRKIINWIKKVNEHIDEDK